MDWIDKIHFTEEYGLITLAFHGVRDKKTNSIIHSNYFSHRVTSFCLVVLSINLS